MTAAAAPRSGRAGELGLLLLAVGIAFLAAVAVSVAHSGSLSADAVAYPVALLLLFGVAHLGVRLLAPHADPVLLPVAALLNGLGIVLVRRLDNASTDTAQRLGRSLAHHRSDSALQLVWTAVAVLVFLGVLAVVRDHTRLSRYTYTSGAAGIVLLLLPSVPGLGESINGARLWVHLGPMTVQPSEVAKLVILVFLASYLVAKREVLALASRRVAGLDLPRARDLGPVLLAWLASLAVLVRENDFGTSLLFFAAFVVLLYIATERTSWILIASPLFLLGGAGAYLLVPHVHQRVAVWLDPFAHAQTTGYQLVQGLFGFGTGGLTGTGLGLGSPSLVPFAKTDFILAAIGEELGLAGLVVVLLLFALLVGRGLRIALSCRDSFGKLLAAGLAVSLGLQVFVIAGGVTGLIPLTGVTTPWLSYGGSSVVANWALVALLLRISDAGRGPGPAAVTPGAARQALADAPTQVVRRR